MSQHFSSHGVDFTCNSDFSGAVEIVRGGEGISVPGEAILEFVAHCYVLQERINALTRQSARKLLNPLEEQR